MQELMFARPVQEDLACTSCHSSLMAHAITAVMPCTASKHLARMPSLANWVSTPVAIWNKSAGACHNHCAAETAARCSALLLAMNSNAGLRLLSCFAHQRGTLHMLLLQRFYA